MDIKKNIKLKSLQIAESDVEIIKRMAESYNVDFHTFLKNLLPMSSKKVVQLRISEDDYLRISERARSFKMKNSRYCRLCSLKGIDNYDKYINDVRMISNVVGNRSRKVNINFDDAGEYQKISEFAILNDIPISSLIRFFSLEVEL